MKKNELMNGDIVVLSSGSVAVVIGDGQDAYLLYQYSGFELLDEYDDNLCNKIDGDKVMQVFRSNGAFGLEGVDQEVPIWERDESWECPSEKEREEQHRIAVERHETELNEFLERMSESQNDLLFIVAQAFYGNSTGTEIRKENVDQFILGHLDDHPFNELVDRTVIRLPGSTELVLIYNKYQEADALNDKECAFRENGYVMKPLAVIPEFDLELYSRCIVCRMNSDGELKSVQNEDFEILNRYLAR